MKQYIVRRKHKNLNFPDRLFRHFKSKDEALIFAANRNADESAKQLGVEYIVEVVEVNV